MFAKATNVGFAQRVVATLVASAMLLWSIGVYSTAQAANLTVISDTLSDSDLSAVSNHTITFSTPSGVAADGSTITIDFTDGPFDTTGLSFDDVDVSVVGTGDLTLAAVCGGGGDDIGAAFAGNVLTLTVCTGEGGAIAAFGTTTIEIGTNATFQTTGNNQIVNPGVAGSYEFVVTAGTAPDTGRMRVAIIDNVLVTAIVDTSFDFTIYGTATGTAVNGTTTSGSSTPTTIPFGTIGNGDVKTIAQRLTVATNARNGFVVTVHTDGDLQSSTGAIIDTFANGADLSTTSNSWVSPANIVTDETTWGHWGMTYDDDATVDLGANEYVAASTTPREVFSHDGPADEWTTNIGSTTVGYQIEITALQEAADDYSTILTYIATPTF
ncbi:MAG: hypothetical protein KC877_00600 [Candidatus Kaiserbacteria bacterium]|nr:hypothetical protein [Candidatus Kaiserbacteria bacterium]MCB9815930.1 hypothetical protein [Candidatus Nomurabacteria bacterium]